MPTVKMLNCGLIGSALYAFLLGSAANSQNPLRYPTFSQAAAPEAECDALAANPDD
jgi:hypothetical protein